MARYSVVYPKFTELVIRGSRLSQMKIRNSYFQNIISIIFWFFVPIVIHFKTIFSYFKKFIYFFENYILDKR